MKRLAAVLVLVAACGGDDTATPDAPGGADAPPVADARPPDAEPVAKEGIVIVAEETDPNGAQSTVGVTIGQGALFGGPSATASGCGFYGTPDDTGESAGVVTITGTAVDVTATPDGVTPPVSYDAGTLPDDLFAPAATLTITAEGATVPAFTGTVTTPAALAAVTLPDAISRANPNIITWTAGTGDEMWAWLLAPSGGGAVNLLWCRAPDTGSFTFPADAMALVPNAATQGLVILWRTNASPVRAGAWDIALTAADAVGTDLLAIGP